MATSKRSRFCCGVAALLLILIGPAQAISLQTASGTYLEIETEDDGQLTAMKLWLGSNALRMDDAGVSVISIGGVDGKMLMVFHEQKGYMEFTAEMMVGMAAVMGRMQPKIEEEIADATPPTFTRTGNTKQVGEWAAYEVLVNHPDADDTIIWFSHDVDADFRAVAEQVVESLSSLRNSPLMRMGGGGGAAGIFDQIQAQLGAVDMPDGFPVQMISGGGSQRTRTLKVIDGNVTFDAATWEAPEGYTKMAMPFGR